MIWLGSKGDAPLCWKRRGLSDEEGVNRSGEWKDDGWMNQAERSGFHLLIKVSYVKSVRQLISISSIRVVRKPRPLQGFNRRCFRSRDWRRACQNRDIDLTTVVMTESRNDFPAAHRYTFRTERLLCRPLHLDDTEDTFAWKSDPQVYYWT